MPIVDLTWEFSGERFTPEIETEHLFLRSGKTSYTGVVYKMTHDGMTGSYIDFPGHIAETDNGLYADNCPVESVYRIPASVIHLDRESGSGAVSADDLEQAFGGKISSAGLIINALGKRQPKDIAPRSVFLDQSAVQWIIDSGCRFLVSDIYESCELEGVFLRLFKAGISTVCMPYDLHKVTESEVKMTILFAKMPRVTQLPCRLVVEF